MEITIDTKRDSREDIRKAVEFLKGFLDNGPSNASSGPSDRQDAPAPQPGLFGMFGSDDQSSGSSSSSQEPSSSQGGSSDDSSPDDGSPERIEIVPY